MKWLKFWRWPREMAKKQAWKFIDEKWEHYEKEAVEWAEKNVLDSSPSRLMSQTRLKA